jgi:arsenite-transporting ATPase
MRIILFAGKGGVGKTSVASATGVMASRMGHKTLIMSLDIAHSLSDVFSLKKGLMDKNGGKPVKISNRLWIQELDIQEEIRRSWGDIHKYIATLFNTTGFDEILAEELAVLPGMEEVSSLLYLNRYVQEKEYDVIVLDCAPTGESLRFISIPTALEWYIEKIFKIERSAVRLIRPVSKPFFNIPLPEDSYFKALKVLFKGLQGVDKVLTNPKITSVRLVTNPEKIVLQETQRAFLYFSLYRMCIDAVVMNRVLPKSIREGYFKNWKASQTEHLKLAEQYFHPIPIFPVDLFPREPVGTDNLAEFGSCLYKKQDPVKWFYREQPYEFLKGENQFIIKVKMPFLEKKDIEINRFPEEVILQVGGFKKHVLLPRYASAYEHVSAKMEGDVLKIIFGGKKCQKKPKGTRKP